MCTEPTLESGEVIGREEDNTMATLCQERRHHGGYLCRNVVVVCKSVVTVINMRSSLGGPS